MERRNATVAVIGAGDYIGAPTFFVGSEMFFGKDRLREAEEAILAAR